MLILVGYVLIEQSSNRITITNHTDDSIEILSITITDLREVPAYGALPTDSFLHTEFEETGEIRRFPAFSLGAHAHVSFSLPHHQVRLVVKHRTRCKTPIFWDQPIAEWETEMFVIRSWGWHGDAKFIPSMGGLRRSNHPDFVHPWQPSFLRRMYEQSRDVLESRSLPSLVPPPVAVPQKNWSGSSAADQW